MHVEKSSDRAVTLRAARQPYGHRQHKTNADIKIMF
jgi:hypothetical protein